MATVVASNLVGLSCQRLDLLKNQLDFVPDDHEDNAAVGRVPDARLDVVQAAI